MQSQHKIFHVCDRSQFNYAALRFIGIHIACLAVFWLGVDSVAIWMCVALFLVRKFGITEGYHRNFSNRAYKTSRGFQFLLAFLGATVRQKGSTWCAAHHRHQHKYSDTDQDIHSAKKQCFYWSHIG